MNRSPKWTARAVSAAGLMTAALMVASAAHAESPFGALQGSWSGSGSVQFEGGQSERLRCTAYYTSGGGGNELGLAIRCASASNKIELRGRLTYADGNVSGTWEERTYNATGTASGKANSGNVALRLAGAIPGTMNLTFSKARQSVAISTQGSKVKAVNIGLSRR